MSSQLMKQKVTIKKKKKKKQKTQINGKFNVISSADENK
jgi:hypothetical protein